MSVEEKAQQVETQSRDIISKAREINQLASIILLKIGDIELPITFKQQLLTKYSTLKAELTTLINNLP